MPAVNVAKLAIQLEAHGADQVVGHINRVSDAAEGLSPKFTRAGFHIAEATGRLSEMGTVGLGSISRLVLGISEFASYFGPAGLVVSAVAAAAGVIISLFTKAREEAKKTREAFDEEIGKMLDSGDRVGLMKRARDLQQGTPSKDFADGLTAMQQRLQSLRDAQAQAATQFLGVAQASGFDAPIRALEKQIAERTAELKKIETALQTADTRTTLGQLGTVTVTAAHRETPEEITARLAKAAAAREAAAAKAHQELLKEEEAFQAALVLAEQQRVATTLQIEAGYLAQSKAMLARAIGASGDPFSTTANPDNLIGASNLDETVRASINDTVALIQKGVADGDFGALHDTGFNMSSSIVEGFQAGFEGHGIEGALASFGASVLSGLGSTIVSMGVTIGIFGALMVKLHAALIAHPLAAGFIALAVGAAMVALGSSLSSIAAGGSGAGASASGITGAGTATNAAEVTNITLASSGTTTASQLTPPTPITIGPIIGPNDGQAQRAIIDLVNNGLGRGLALAGT